MAVKIRLVIMIKKKTTSATAAITTMNADTAGSLRENGMKKKRFIREGGKKSCRSTGRQILFRAGLTFAFLSDKGASSFSSFRLPQ